MGLNELTRVEGDDAKRLLAASKVPETAKHYLGKGAPVLVHEGDLIVDGDLFLPLHGEGPFHLVVRGDLIVSGDYADCDDPECSVMVTGSLRSRTAVTNGRLEVHGDLIADTVIGDYNDHSCSVGGTLRCRLLITGEHHFDVGRVEVELSLGGARIQYAEGELTSAEERFEDEHDDDDEEDETPLHRFYCSLLAAEVVHSELEEDGLHFDIWLDNARMHRLVRQGKSPLARASTKPE